jgi:hypothetical protein
MGILDTLVLAATGLVAIYLIVRFAQHYRQAERRLPDVYYLIGTVVLLVAGLLLIIFGYSALSSPLVVIAATLIPAGLAMGLVADLYPKCEKYFLIFLVVGIIALSITRFTGPATLSTIILIIVHSVAGLTIFILPVMAVSKGRAHGGFIWVTVGGALIGLGGIALAVLKSGSQLLFFSTGFVLTILAPLLLLMTLAFTWGFVIKLRRGLS